MAKQATPRRRQQSVPPGQFPVSVRLVRGSEDAMRLDRLAAIYGGRSAALRAGLEALERATEVSR